MAVLSPPRAFGDSVAFWQANIRNQKKKADGIAIGLQDVSALSQGLKSCLMA